MTDYLIRAETLASSSEVAGEKISEKLLVSVVLKGLPDSYEYLRRCTIFQKLPLRFLILKRLSKILQTRRNWKIAVTWVTLSQKQRCLFREIILRIFLVNVSAATSAGIWNVLVQLNSALFAKSLDTMSLSVFRNQNWTKRLRIGRIFCRVVSFLLIAVLIVRKVRNLFWIPVVRHIFSMMKIFLLNFMMFLQKFVNANNSVSPVKGQGVAKISLLDKRGVSQVLNLSDCFYVPDHSRNLLSVSALGQKGAKVVFDDTCELRCSDKFSFLFVQRNGLYVTKVFSVCSSNFSSTCKVELDLWHCRLGHSNKSDFQKLSKSVQGMKLHNSSVSESFCDICAASKLNRKPPSSKMALRKSSKLELVYSDVRCPMETTSLGGRRYVVSFIDSYSRFARAYFMKDKSEVLENFHQFCIDEVVPKTFSSLTLRSDGGCEFDNKAFDEFCFAQGIKREMTAPYSPHENGATERRCQTVWNMARCLLKQVNLPNSFWVRAVDVAFYLTNRCFKW